jgi:hypothetical protein
MMPGNESTEVKTLMEMVEKRILLSLQSVAENLTMITPNATWSDEGIRAVLIWRRGIHRQNIGSHW